MDKEKEQDVSQPPKEGSATIYSPHFDSYNKWLTDRNLPLETIPDPVEPILTMDYRTWRYTKPEDRPAHSRHREIQHGDYSNFASFGMHRALIDRNSQDIKDILALRAGRLHKNLPKFGPLNLDQFYPARFDYGPDFDQPFDDNEKSRNILGIFGYTIVSNVTKGSPKVPFDHQIWVVRKNKMDFEVYKVPEIKEGEEYACKMVAAHYFFNREKKGLSEDVPIMTSNMMTRMEKESSVLRALNHNNIIKVLDVFGIQDSHTLFYVFLASIMERMSGSIEDMAKNSRDNQGQFNLSNDVITAITIQMIKAVDYLHNQDPKFVYVHQAIRPANILYNTTTEEDPRPQYKLIDFEECLIYNRKNIEPNIPFDTLPQNERKVYTTTWSSPEYLNAYWTEAYPPDLRTMPNDVFGVAATACYLLRADIDAMVDWLHSLEYEETPLNELLRLMTIQNPELRIAAKDLVKHQYFKALDV